MSNRNNDVYQVLVTKGNTAVLAKGLALEGLAVGQLGVFDAKTNLSIDATTTPVPREIFLAVGVDTTGGAVLNDIKQSAGQMIQKAGLTAYSFKPHTAGQPMISTVSGFQANADTEYGIRVEFRNSRIYRIQGFNQFSKAYLVQTPTLEADAQAGDANTLSKLFVAAINADEAGLLVAKFVARQALVAATHGTSVNYAAGAVMTSADVDALLTFNATAIAGTEVYADFSLTSVPLKVGNFCQVNLGYHKLLETVLIVSLVEGFTSSGTTVVSQYPVFEEGSANNIMQKEYHASGWTGSGPYKLSEVTGTAKGDITYFAVAGTAYDQFILEYNQRSESGWKEYDNALSTVIAIPEANTVTRASVATLLDVIFAGGAFEALADDAALANVNPAVVEPVVTSQLSDGIA